MGSEAPTWADQWGNGGMEDYHGKQDGGNSSKGKKMGSVKAAASAGLEKAKSAAPAGAQMVKSGTSMGISWIKTKYNSKKSSR